MDTHLLFDVLDGSGDRFQAGLLVERISAEEHIPSGTLPTSGLNKKDIHKYFNSYQTSDIDIPLDDLEALVRGYNLSEFWQKIGLGS